MTENLSAGCDSSHPGGDSLSLTITKTVGGIPARKKVKQGQGGLIETVADYPQGLTYWTREIHTIPRDIDALAAFIEETASRPDCCLVTGTPCGAIPLDKPARRIKNTHRTGDLPTLAERENVLIPVDCDDIPINGRLDPIDPEPAIAEVVSKLGKPFASCSYVWQLSARATPGADQIRVRLFFLSNQEISNDALRSWAKSHNRTIGIKLIDPAPFTATQPIYTAFPEFIGPDPFPRRIGVVYGEQELVPWSKVQIQGDEGYTFQGSVERGPVHASIEEYLAAIGDGEKGEGCHEAINRAVISMVRHRWTDERIMQAIRERVGEAEWSAKRGHTPAYLQNETSDWKLRASIRGAEKFIQATANPPRVTQTRPVLETVALPVAMIQAQEIVSRWVRGEGPDRLVLGLTVGAGKTHATVEAIKRDLPEDQNLVWAFPTHNQGEEVQGKMELEDFGSEFAIKIESRVREKDGAAPLCARPGLIKAIAEAGLQSRTATIACKSKHGECPYYRGCDYYRQFRGEHRVRLVAHSTLATRQARAINDQFMVNVAGLVIDESPIDTLLGRKSYLLAEIQNDGGVIADIVDMVRKGIEPETIDDVPALIERLEEERNERCVIEGLFHSPDARDEWGLMQELAQRSETKRPGLLPLYHAAIAWVSGDKNLIWMGREKVKDVVLDSVIVAWRFPIPDIKRVLVLDATPNEEAYRAILGEEVEIIRIDVEQNLEIVQASDTPLGKRRLSDPDNDGILARSVSLARAMGGGFISNKAVIDLAKAKGYLSADDQTGHFNALRGLNAMESLDALVIAGRPEPDAIDIEAKARALFPKDDLVLGGRYVWRTDGISSVASHPDPRCDSLLRSFREGEIEQAIGRLRAVRSPRTKRVFILTHTPVSLPGIKKMALDQILMPEGLARLLLKFNGVAPLVPTFMAGSLPEIWSSPKAAEDWLRRVLKPANPLGIYLLKASAGFKFRATGQKRGSRCLSWHDQFDTWQILEEVMGIEVVECAEAGAEGNPAPPPETVQVEPEPVPDRTVIWSRPSFQVFNLTELIPELRGRIAAIFEIPPPPLIEEPIFAGDF